MNLLLNWLLSALSLMIVANVVAGFELSGFTAALIAALVVGFINATLGLIIKILTFPLTLVTFGLFWFVVNAIMLAVAAAFVPGFRIHGFGPAFIGAIVLSLVNLFMKMVGRAIAEDRSRL
jgi:putative membrane protein